MSFNKKAEDYFYDIKIRRDGTWLYGGTPITRHNMVKLFSTVLKKDEKGGYWLETPVEKGRIEVEDAPFIAVEMAQRSSGGAQILLFRTNVDDWVEADLAHPLRFSPAPYVMVRNGLEARLSRPVYYALMELAVESAEEKGLYGLWSHNAFFPIGRI